MIWQGADERLLDALFRVSAGNLAVAVALLPRRFRAEARVAFLACRALDAYEDLSRDRASACRGLTQAVAYLAGDRAQPPSADFLHASGERDRVETLIAERLPLLRTALGRLPRASRSRILRLAEDIAHAMARHITVERGSRAPDLVTYGRDVLGRATRYAIELLETRTRWAIDTESIGRLVQAANLLRDRDRDRASGRAAVPGDSTESRIRLLLDIAETAPMVAHALSSLRFPWISRTRAALTYMAATTARFLLRDVGVTLPPWAARPWRITAASWYSPRAFAAFVTDLQNVMLSSVVHVTVPGEAGEPARPAVVLPYVRPAVRRRQYDFEARLADRHPDPSCRFALARASQLAHSVLRLSAALPRGREHDAGEAPAVLVMMTDYLLACGVRAVAPLGPAVLVRLGMLVSAMAAKAEHRDLVDDEDGDIAAFLSAVVLGACAVRDSAAAAETVRHRRTARRCHRGDYGLRHAGRPAFMRLTSPGTPRAHHA